MRMRSIGSICTATVNGMAESVPVSRGPAYTLRQGGGEAAPARRRRRRRADSAPAAQGLRASQTRAARQMRRRLVSRDRARRRVEVVARLDLDEGDRRAAPRDEVDLAAGGGEAAGEDAVALQPQQQRGDRLGAQAEQMGAPPRPGRPRWPSPPRPGEPERPRVDLASRQAGLDRHRGGGVLDRQRGERVEDHRVERLGRRPGGAARGGPTTTTISPFGASGGGVMGGELGQRRAARLLVQLGQFARHRRRPRPEPGGEVGERLGEPAGRFVEDAASPGSPPAPSIRSRRAAALAGRKPSKKKRSVGSAAVVSAAIAAHGPGRAEDRDPRRRRLDHQLVAGVGDERRAGVGDQRQRFAGGEAGEDARARLRRRCARDRRRAARRCRSGRAGGG